MCELQIKRLPPFRSLSQLGSVLITAVRGSSRAQGRLSGEALAGKAWELGFRFPAPTYMPGEQGHLRPTAQETRDLSSMCSVWTSHTIKLWGPVSNLAFIYRWRIIEVNLWTPHMYACTPVHTQVSTHVHIQKLHTQTHTENYFLNIRGDAVWGAETRPSNCTEVKRLSAHA